MVPAEFICVRPFRAVSSPLLTRSSLAMLPAAIVLFTLLLLESPVLGLVAGAEVATDNIARSVVGIVGSNSFCTATAIAHDLVLTAGHCVKSGVNYKVQLKDTNGTKTFSDIVDWARPPEFQVLPSKVTADLALAKLGNSLPPSVGVAMLSLNTAPIWPGDRFTIIGEGITLKGLHQTGVNRAATLVATAPFTDLQIRLIDPSGSNTGVCPGDSGSPVFQTQGDDMKMIGVVSWRLGRKRDCGGVTGAIPLTPYRHWIEETVIKFGGTPGHDTPPH
jgi:hypothetical protein